MFPFIDIEPYSLSDWFAQRSKALTKPNTVIPISSAKHGEPPTPIMAQPVHRANAA